MINLPDRAEAVPEWELEPDEATFVSHGYWCEVKRHPELGHLCGYVLMGAHHPLASETEPDLAVHGGITYNSGTKMGFDCGHTGDISPYLATRYGLRNYSDPNYHERYRNMAFVKGQLENLAAQLREVDPIVEVKRLDPC
jgi:hypothetical protein